MFSALGRLVIRRTKSVLCGSLVAFVVTVIAGGGIFANLSAAGFDDPDSDSARLPELVPSTYGRHL